MATDGIALQTIAALKLAALGQSPATVRLEGTVLDARPGEYIVVHDRTGTIYAETRQMALPQIKSQVEIQGQPYFDGYVITLKDAVVVSLDKESPAINGTSVTPPPGTVLPLLTNIWEIRDLPAEKSIWHYPVRLRAVVTVNTKSNHYFVIQDNSGGISVRTSELAVSWNPGDLILIEGVTDPGGYAPIVLASNVTRIATVPLPAPQPETLFQLATGRDGSQWIEVRGVVRAMSFTNGLARLTLNDPSGMLPVYVPAKAEPRELLDAMVNIRGACGSRANSKRQLTGFEMWVSSLADIQVEELGANDPLNLPAQPITSLGQFHPRQTLQHRVNIAGVVSLCEARGFFVEDAEAGVEVLCNDSVAGLQPGDYVMAAGYPGLGNYGYRLQDAVYKVIRHRNPPGPQRLPPDRSLDPEWHDRWVRLDARFLHHNTVGLNDVLTLECGTHIFEARCLTPLSSRIKQLPPGSLLQLDGLYRVLVDEARVPASFQLTVPTEAELQVLEKPSWWSIEHTFTVIGTMSVAIGAAILWVLMLRRKVQEKTASLRQSEQKFRGLVEQPLVGVYLVQSGRFTYVNPQMAAIFGYPSEEILQFDSILKIVHPIDHSLVSEQIRRRIQNEVELVHYFFRGIHKLGHELRIEVHGSRMEFNGKPAVLGMLMDVTERQRAQDKIVEQARMLDLASDAIVVSDLEDRIRYWNQSAQRIFGCPLETALGQKAPELMRISPEAYQAARQAVLEHSLWRGEFTHAGLHGGDLVVAARWTLVRDSDGHPVAILSLLTDITQQKKLEAQFLRAQRMESIGVLAGGIAHDLNNTLSPILISTHLLELETDDQERQELIGNILTSAQRAANLVQQILTFARGSDGRHLPVEPRHLLDESRKILGQTLPKSIRLEVSCATRNWTVSVDATQIHQVLMNLSINARDAMPQGGTLTLAATNVDLDPAAAAQHPGAQPGPHVVFSITDTGCGMSGKVCERIFDPFFTTKEVGRGTGLGLSTSMGIIKSHGGFITVYSELNRGS